MTAPLILHHYDFSNYSEKIRLILGLKRLAWHAVTIPATAPKPDYTPLTAGYRRTPALQIGADVYCDTRLIAAELEHRYPQPTLYPGPWPDRTRALCEALTSWEENALQRPLALYITGLHAERFGAEFHADRARLHRKAQPTVAQVRAAADKYAPQVMAQLEWIEAMLSDGGEYLFGDAVSLADISLYQAPWFLRVIGGDDALPRRFARIERWARRISAIGHGEITPMSAAAARACAAAAIPQACAARVVGLTDAIEPGQRVSVRPFDQDTAAEGILVACDDVRVTIATTLDDGASVHVHFPRLDYRVRRARA